MNSSCYLGDNVVLLRTQYGSKMYVDSRDTVVAPHLILDGVWEAWVTRFIETMVATGDTFVDVGANVGWFTLRAAQLVGPGGRVEAFEPLGHLVELLERTLMINGIRHAHVNAKACDDRTAGAAPRRVLCDPYFNGNARLEREEDANAAEVRWLTSTTRLDYHFAELPERHRKSVFIKIDAEGAEPDVIRGASNILSWPNLSLLVEHHAPLRPAETAAFRDLLERGYKMSLLEHTSTLRPLTLAALEGVPDSEMIYFSR